MTRSYISNKKARFTRARFLIYISIFIFIEEGIWKTHQEASSDKVSNEVTPQWRSIFPTPKLAIESAATLNLTIAKEAKFAAMCSFVKNTNM
mgnify:CR=1 FL=1